MEVADTWLNTPDHNHQTSQNTNIEDEEPPTWKKYIPSRPSNTKRYDGNDYLPTFDQLSTPRSCRTDKKRFSHTPPSLNRDEKIFSALVAKNSARILDAGFYPAPVHSTNPCGKKISPEGCPGAAEGGHAPEALCSASCFCSNGPSSLVPRGHKKSDVRPLNDQELGHFRVRPRPTPM
ncbi:hypothetical protein EVAR_44938_1 [Eumeta japonica]|uniref:Uncharacterized protein n=1 Tax=Eumeta variegata TaxID=151549 RepID=A0A4C1W4A6_EUMVA|nr:hypothetical protein EVAR_44938_1 [Eumeta japonica]